MVLVIQLAIMGSSAVGGLLRDISGYQATVSFSTIILVLAAVIAVVSYSDNDQSEHNLQNTKLQNNFYFNMMDK